MACLLFKRDGKRVGYMGLSDLPITCSIALQSLAAYPVITKAMEVTPHSS